MAVPTANPADRVVAGAIDDVQFHHRGFQQCQCPPLAPLGRWRAGQGDQLGLGGAVEDALSGRVGRVLVGQGGVDPALHQVLARARDGVDAGIQRFSDSAVAPRLAGLRGIGLQQDAGFQNLACRAFAFLDQRVEPFALLVGEPDNVLLHGRLFRGHSASPMGAERSIQRSTAESTTGGTRG